MRLRGEIKGIGGLEGYFYFYIFVRATYGRIYPRLWYGTVILCLLWCWFRTVFGFGAAIGKVGEACSWRAVFNAAR